MAPEHEAQEQATPELALARTFAEIARALLADDTLPATLARICQLAVTTIEGCDHAGITLVQGRKLSTEGASEGVSQRVDAIQYETNESLCLDAIRDHEVFRTDDLAEEARWPLFARRAVEESGIHSMLSFRLFADNDTMGALNLHFGGPRRVSTSDWPRWRRVSPPASRHPLRLSEATAGC